MSEQGLRERIKRFFKNTPPKKTEGKESSKKTQIPPKKVFSLAMKAARPITKALRSDGDNAKDEGVDSTAVAGGAPSNGLSWMAGGIIGYTGGDGAGTTAVGDTNGGYTNESYTNGDYTSGGYTNGDYSSSGAGDYGGGGYSGGGDTGGGYSGGGDTGGADW